jgi:mannosyltransferase OCH1-like enzyme
MIHQIWFQGDPPKSIHDMMTRYFPDARIWHELEILHLIKTHYSEYFAWFQNIRTLIVKCDVARAFILHHHGGIYVDCDFAPNERFGEFKIADRVAFVHDPWFGCNNYLISSPKGSKFWLKYLDAVAETLQEPLIQDMFASVLMTTWPVLSLSGPVQIRRLIIKFPQFAFIQGRENYFGLHGGRDESSGWFSMRQYRIQKYSVLFLFFFAVIGIWSCFRACF